MITAQVGKYDPEKSTTKDVTDCNFLKIEFYKLITDSKVGDGSRRPPQLGRNLESASSVTPAL